MARQRCPNCQDVQDVSVYVTGQRISCRRCNIRFDVVREDVPRASSGRSVEPPAVPRPPRAEALLAAALPPPVPAPASFAASAETSRGGPSFLAKTLTRGAVQTAVAREAVRPPAIAGFELLGQLGRGGMGEVWRARQLSLGRDVALKTLAAHLAQEPDFVRRFEKEATALAALSHPNVVAIFDRGCASGVYYLVMELVSGRSLRERMSMGPLPVPEVGAIVAQLLAAMDYAHRRGVIHRDLKPENVLLAADGTVKVADFGLAAILGGDSALHVTKPAVAMGTLSYMAPEQRRDAHSVDGRADLYSVGVILFELLTGELPIGRLRLPSVRTRATGRRLDGLLERALQEAPESRFSTASEMSSELARALEGPDEPGVRRWLRRLKG
ncbi:MAG: serine/threonine-protein kinase [Deltaproteobacteria bacterium]